MNKHRSQKDRTNRKIIHVDMDCFYAAVEMRDQPSLRNQPIAVGGSPEERGVIATANYRAREYGIHSAMPSHQAVKKCSDLKLISPDFDKYRSETRAIRSIFHRYTDQIEPISLDEAYLDVSQSRSCQGSATKIAQSIRKDLQKERQLTASAGAAPNKFLAKVGSDWNKPDGLMVIPPAKIDSFMQSLSVNQIPGVGDATQTRLHDRGITTCGELQSYSRKELLNTFGKWGLQLYRLCRGIDRRPVTVNRVRKSLSVERTFSEDCETAEQVRNALDSVYSKFLRRWENARIETERIQSLTVKVKFSDFQQITRARRHENLPPKQRYARIIRRIWQTDARNIRLIGLGVKLCSPRKGDYRKAQQSLFS